MVWPPWQLHLVHHTTGKPGVSGIWSHSSAVTGDSSHQLINLGLLNVRRQASASQKQALSAIGLGGLSPPHSP
jgi:hypothetical protein